MTLGNWCIVSDKGDYYTVAKSDDEIVSVDYRGETIITIHLNQKDPIVVTENAIIKIDAENKRLVVCSPNDNVKRIND